MNECNIFLKGRNSQHDAVGIISGDVVKVLKGSRVSEKYDEGISNFAKIYREDKKILDSNNILLRDIEFQSASTAAQFVTGHSTNGLRAWKLNDGNALGTITNGKVRKQSKEK